MLGEIRTLTPEDIGRMSDSFLSVANDIEGEYWTAENFLRDLPGKWELSFAIWLDGRPIAYAILSMKAKGHAHLHHFMVASAHRGAGIGTCMAEEMERRVRIAAGRLLTLRVSEGNTRAQDFYRRLGYRSGACEGAYVVYEKKI